MLLLNVTDLYVIDKLCLWFAKVMLEGIGRVLKSGLRGPTVRSAVACTRGKVELATGGPFKTSNLEMSARPPRPTVCVFDVQRYCMILLHHVTNGMEMAISFISLLNHLQGLNVVTPSLGAASLPFSWHSSRRMHSHRYMDINRVIVKSCVLVAFL